jgi:threonine dehydrogenase-like Zn-dependent dehydrogenase
MAGLVALLSAKAFGADRVVITDLLSSKLDTAKRLGADAGLQVTLEETPDCVADRIRAALPRHGPDIVIDCAGFESTIQVCARQAKPVQCRKAIKAWCGK